jgi:non-specific serine/threonine protein kinase/serine/threonine-protein kinase
MGERPQDHAREQELFQTCLDLPPAQRDAHLEHACGADIHLLARVSRLLVAHARAEQGTPSLPLHALIPEDLTDCIGPYRLVHVLGEGGMGTVYEAEQLEPVRRRVALKIVKLGMDTQEVVARFMTERQALAAMDHPFVAKVFDAGQTAAGRPYFVMELVEGVPLLDYSDAHRLSLGERVELFILICHAVQHAHLKGVVHRDLKPSNVLVTATPQPPEPKIIDFGIAKAVGRDWHGSVVGFTRTDQPLGTPAYMSPEQAGFGRLDVDSRTDVYSLGVILYELLAGCLPADPAAIGPPEFLSSLAKGELSMSRPSARVCLPSTGAETAAARSTTPSGLKRQLEGDLDWIVMKALEVDRGRRFETALALADDLQRYMSEKPVTARPPTFSYQFSKFVRRHRVQVVAATVAIVALLVGTIAAAVGMVRASRAEGTAREEAATARQVSDFLVRLLTLASPDQAPGNPTTVREMLERGVSTIETDLKEQPAVQANLFGTLSIVYEALGQYPESKRFAEKSLALPRTAGRDADLQAAGLLLQLGRAHQRLGDLAQTRTSYERALALRIRVLGENHLDVARVLNNLGALHGQMERYDEATSAHERALAIQRRVGGPSHKDVGHSLRGLAIVQDRQGHVEAGLGLFRQAQAIFEASYGPEHTVTATVLQDIAVSLRTLNRPHEAHPLLERSLAILKRIHGPDHPTVSFTDHSLGLVLMAQGELKAALPILEDGFRIRMATMGPHNPRTADIAGSLAMLRVSLGDLDKGRQLLEQALRGHEQAYGPDHRSTLETRGNLARTLVKAKRYDEAMPHLEQIVLRDVPPSLRIDLGDPSFDRMRKMRAFRELETRVSRRQQERKEAGPGPDSPSR